MQKYTSFLNKTVFNSQSNAASANKMQPTEATLKSILQFAASYRVVKIGKNQFIETNLN